MRAKRINALSIASHFSYLEDIPKFILGMCDKIFYEYNLAGSRESAKTYSICITLAMSLIAALKSGKKVAIYAFRWQNTDVKALQEEIDGVLDKMGLLPYLNFTFGQYKPKYTFKKRYNNKSFIQILGIHTTRTDKIALKGLTSISNYSLGIIFIEEANEFSGLERMSIVHGIRGGVNTQLVFLTACNPEHISNSHIKYLDDHLSFSLYKLQHNFQQIKALKEPKSNLKKLFHYANWRLNPYISVLSKQKMLDLEKRNPALALVWSFGMIGNRSDSVFAQYLKQADKLLTWTPRYYTGGLDLGVSDASTAHPTAAAMWAMDGKQCKLYKLNEWYHDNITGSKMKRANVLEAIVYFFYFEMKKWEVSYLVVQVDYGNGGLWAIDTLNARMRNLREQNKIMAGYAIEFVGVKKEVYYLKDRVDITVMGIQAGWIQYNFNKCPETRRQYGLMKYKTPNANSKNVYELIDKFDDSWDADFYAWCPYLKTLMTNTNREKEQPLSIGWGMDGFINDNLRHNNW